MVIFGLIDAALAAFFVVAFLFQPRAGNTWDNESDPCARHCVGEGDAAARPGISTTEPATPVTADTRRKQFSQLRALDRAGAHRRIPTAAH